MSPVERALPLLIVALLVAAANRGQAASPGSPQNQPAAAHADSTLGRDSATVRDLLREALGEARRVRGAERTDLIGKIGHLQGAAGDFEGAARTVAELGADHVLHDRFVIVGSTTNLVCRLLEERQLAAAESVVARSEPAATRAWLQAHLASQLVRPPQSTRRSNSPAATPWPERWSAAFGLATRIPVAEARLDALVALAFRADSFPAEGRAARAAAARALLDARDVDRASSRRAMLAALAARVGDYAAARAQFAQLRIAEDRPYVLSYLPHLLWEAHRDSTKVDWARADSLRTLMRELAGPTADDARRVTDPIVRRRWLAMVRRDLTQAGERALADSLIPQAMITAASAAATGAERTAAPLPSARDRAMEALIRGDFPAVRRHVAEITDPSRQGLAAEAWSELAWAARSLPLDTPATYLDLARLALLRVRPDSARFDELASSIAHQQFILGRHEDGLQTLDLVRDPEQTSYAVRQWGGSTFAGLTGARHRAFADQLRHPVVRDHVLLRVITGYLAIPSAPAGDLVWARALADSIRTPSVRSLAHVAVARRDLARGDTARARASLLAQLPGRELDRDFPNADDVTSLLLTLGVRDDLVAAARAEGTATRRARALMGIAEQLQRQIDRRDPDRERSWSNGPDGCREEF